MIKNRFIFKITFSFEGYFFLNAREDYFDTLSEQTGDCHVMYSHSSQIVWFSVFNLVNVDKPVANPCQRLSRHVFSFLTDCVV